MPKESILTEERKERAVLVGIDRPNSPWSVESSLAELSRLAFTAGAEVVATTTQRMSAPNPSTFIGSGKAKEVAELVASLDGDVVIFDDELTPSQQSNLEKTVGADVKVIDRTALILDIFALHAKSREGRLQVRLAQNQYLYPRLRGMWAHLASNRMGGGVGSRFGEGESQLEVDRRMVRKRITSIKRELALLSEVRKLQREGRFASGIFKVALAGYTNAGKSSLLNRLCESQVYSDDLLFATLDSTTRRFTLPEGRLITITDTVGFIQKLPTTLIEAFKSTLDEITGADLILHVIDASSAEYEDQIDAVCDVIDQIGASKIPTIMVFNKCDLLEGDAIDSIRSRFPFAQLVSAQTGEGIDALVNRIAMACAASDTTIKIVVPYNRGDLVSIAHEKCSILTECYTEEGTSLTLRVPRGLEKLFEDFIVEE